MTLRILFLSDDREDYLADSLLHGLISMEKHLIVDYPKKEVLYRDSLAEESRKRLYGNGFTLYGLLQDRSVDRTSIWKRLESSQFEIIIISNIWRQFGLLADLKKATEASNARVVALDGDDDPRLYPFSLARLREHGIPIGKLPGSRTLCQNYFKRELDASQPQEWREHLVPRPIRKNIRHFIQSKTSIHPQPCSFSIPAEWIRTPDLKQKRALLPSHIVDKEVSEYFERGQCTYAFNNQNQYFDDIAQARFGITMKRSGWDCLRHYEIAAAGTIPCFRDLDKKPEQSAPHGLNRNNCVIYNSAKDLESQIRSMSEKDYWHLLERSHEWVKSNTTICSAERLLEAIAP